MISRIIKISLLVAVCLLIGVIAFSDEGKKEEIATAGNLELHKIFQDKQSEFSEQMEYVKKEYPLVALAFQIQEAALTQRIEHQATEHIEIDRYWGSLTGQETINTNAAIKWKFCLDKLKKELGRAKTYEEGQGAFDRHSNCLKGADRVTVE